MPTSISASLISRARLTAKATPAPAKPMAAKNISVRIIAADTILLLHFQEEREARISPMSGRAGAADLQGVRRLRPSHLRASDREARPVLHADRPAPVCGRERKRSGRENRPAPATSLQRHAIGCGHRRSCKSHWNPAASAAANSRHSAWPPYPLRCLFGGEGGASRVPYGLLGPYCR